MLHSEELPYKYRQKSSKMTFFELRNILLPYIELKFRTEMHVDILYNVYAWLEDSELYLMALPHKNMIKGHILRHSSYPSCQQWNCSWCKGCAATCSTTFIHSLLRWEQAVKSYWAKTFFSSTFFDIFRRVRISSHCARLLVCLVIQLVPCCCLCSWLEKKRVSLGLHAAFRRIAI